MTAPNTNQFDSICPVCNKKITPGHTHEGQSPEEAAALAGNANATNFCFHCGEPGSYEQHEEEGSHTCEACGEPGTSAEHEITGHHTGGTCPRCKLSLTPTHNCLKFSGVTAQKKGGKAAAVAQANTVLGREVPRYEIIEDPDTGLETKTLMNPEAFPTGATEASRKLTSDPRYMGINPDTKEVMYAFDNSGATTASQHAATRGAVLSQPHRSQHYTALVMLHPGVQRPGRAQGLLRVSPSDIVPHTNVVESERDVYESVQKTKVDKAGRTIKVTRKTKNGVKVPVMTYVQKLDKNGQPVKEKYTETHKGVMIGGSFYKDSEIKNISYMLRDRDSGFKQQINDAGETSLVPKSEEELDAEHLARHEANMRSQAIRLRLDQIRNANAAERRESERNRPFEIWAAEKRTRPEIAQAHAAGEHDLGKIRELAAAWIEASSRLQAPPTIPHALNAFPPTIRTGAPTAPIRRAFDMNAWGELPKGDDLEQSEGNKLSEVFIRQAGYPKVSTRTRQVFERGEQVGTAATPYIGAADPETGEQQQGVDVRPVHRAVPAGTETYQVTEPVPDKVGYDAHTAAQTFINNAMFGRLKKAMEATPQISLVKDYSLSHLYDPVTGRGTSRPSLTFIPAPHEAQIASYQSPEDFVDMRKSGCKECAQIFKNLILGTEGATTEALTETDKAAPKKAAPKKTAPKKSSTRSKKGKKS